MESAFSSEDILIGKGTEYELKGKLLIPGSSEKVRGAVLVQGSGPQDMDEKVGANRTFKELAEHLAKNGIASIRYDKRTLTHGQKMVDINEGRDITVEEETIQDAIYAAKMLKNDPRIDADKVFIIGHSLGGMLAPRIDAEGGDFAGIVIMGASPRKLTEIIYDQNVNAIMAMPDEQRTAMEPQLPELKRFLESIQHMTDEEAKATMFGGLAVYYLKDLDSHPPKDYFEKMDKSILVIQGDKDFHVFVESDFEGYRRLIGDRKNATFHLYPGLSHLFNPCINGTVQDYDVPVPMDPGVLKDISDWIKSN